MFITKGICIIIFCISIWAWSNDRLFNSLMHYPYQESRDRSYHRLFTSIFLHGNWLHLLVNLFVFWSFGEAIEYQFALIFGKLTGGILFTALFILSGILADVATMRKHRDNPNFSSVGASGSISGIMFAYVLFYPWQDLYLYGFIPIPGIVAGGLYLWYSSYAAKKEGGRIDHNAHLYGALAGLIFTIVVYPPIIPQFLEQLLSVF